MDCRNADLSFKEGEYGKPFAVVNGRAAALSFSVSHSGRHGLIAYSRDGRLGVDVEQIIPRRQLKSLIEAVMGPDEQRELDQLEAPARLHQFFRLWTCKEALVKALGTGFSTDVSGFQIPPNIRRGEAVGVFRFTHLPDVAWRLEDIGREGFAAALASELPSTGSNSTDRDCRDREVSPAKV
jgi:4'-phosphopantetheinyl transferase